MRVILTKALIENTQVDLSKARLSLGDELKIIFAENGLYYLYFQVNSSWIMRMFRSRKWKLLGNLSDTDGDLITSQLKGAKKARVRIVDISLKQLSTNRLDAVYISVWIG